MFASFKSENRNRACHILCSNDPLGKFSPISNTPITPNGWFCLDATLFIDYLNTPWIVFCREWTEVKDGQIYVAKLDNKLLKIINEPTLLFKASNAKWTLSISNAEEKDEKKYVTDGPFLFNAQNGDLIMLWSSHSINGYAIGQSVSHNGILGPWIHIDKPLFDQDGGHGMLFRKINGDLMLTIHKPNKMPYERAVIYKVEEKDGLIIMSDIVNH